MANLCDGLHIFFTRPCTVAEATYIPLAMCIRKASSVTGHIAACPIRFLALLFFSPAHIFFVQTAAGASHNVFKGLLVLVSCFSRWYRQQIRHKLLNRQDVKDDIRSACSIRAREKMGNPDFLVNPHTERKEAEQIFIITFFPSSLYVRKQLYGWPGGAT